MTAETKTCQNCKIQFTIEPDDFAFYKKINVPPPTWCPQCRTVRRFLFRNERTWYRRTCDITKEPILSMFAPDVSIPVYELNYWRSDAWDPMQYGREADFTRPFFMQWNELFRAVPEPNLVQKNNTESEYTNYTLNLKNCYFCASGDTEEDSAYNFTLVLRARNCLDIHMCTDSEWSYEIVDCLKSNNLRFCQQCEGGLDSWFLFDCRNCSSCVGCVGLRSKQYCIFNTQYSREEYLKKLKELNLGSYKGLQEVRARFENLKLGTPRKFAAIVGSQGVAGDDIQYSRDAQGFCIRNNCEHVRYSYRIADSKDIWDSFVAWNGSELQYEAMACSGQRIFCSALIYGGAGVSYSYNCFDCEEVFGCVGLRSKQYCILNRQYSKEEYMALKEKIITHMSSMPYRDALGRTYGYGEFFPPEYAPFAYNETIAQDYFPSTEKEVAKFGYRWRSRETRNYKVTMTHDAFPDNINDARDSIVNETIACAYAGVDCGEQCAAAFKIIPMELQFYRKLGVPLPRLCPSCRHYARVKLKNPLYLWRGKCRCAGQIAKSGGQIVYRNTTAHFHGDALCPNEFETTFAPDRKEIVYCESCYNSEIA